MCVEQRHNSTDERWDALYRRARLMLDEDGVAAESRRMETAERKLKRAGLDAPPVDLDLVKRTLLEYERTKRYALALESTAATKDEMNLAYDLWPESKTVYEYVQRMRDAARSQEMDEVADLATDKLKTLLKDDKGKCLVNAKLVMSTLERLDRKRFLVDGSAKVAAKEATRETPKPAKAQTIFMGLASSTNIAIPARP